MVRFGVSLRPHLVRLLPPVTTTRSCSGTQLLASTRRPSRSPIAERSLDAVEPPPSPSFLTLSALAQSQSTISGSLLPATMVLSRSELYRPQTTKFNASGTPPSGSRSWPSRPITNIWLWALTTMPSTFTGRLTGVSKANALDTAHTSWPSTGAPTPSSSARTAAPTSCSSSRFPPASRTHPADPT